MPVLGGPLSSFISALNSWFDGMSVNSEITEVTTDSIPDGPRQRNLNSLEKGDVNHVNGDESPTFIVTDPDSDIETDAVPSVPRPRGTPIPDPPKPNYPVNDIPSTNEEIPDKKSSNSESRAKTGKVPHGSFKDKGTSHGGNKLIYNVCNSQNVHFGHNIVYGANLKQPMDSKINEEEPCPAEYEILLSSVKVVNDEHLDCVADNIGRKWKKLGTYLGMKEAAIFRFEQDYQDNHRERVYQLLLEWKQGTGGQTQGPLLARLSLALWQLRERDALDSLVKLEKDPRLNGQVK